MSPTIEFLLKFEHRIRARSRPGQPVLQQAARANIEIIKV
jgi:hypothetical protein